MHPSFRSSQDDTIYCFSRSYQPSSYPLPQTKSSLNSLTLGTPTHSQNFHKWVLILLSAQRKFQGKQHEICCFRNAHGLLYGMEPYPVFRGVRCVLAVPSPPGGDRVMTTCGGTGNDGNTVQGWREGQWIMTEGVWLGVQSDSGPGPSVHQVILQRSFPISLGPYQQKAGLA